MGLLQKMAWSKSTRIKVMIGLDTAFFLLELTTGFLAHSLALMADAFHMLNDIISLIIGLWAVSAAQKATTDEFTFGWVRAEILGAFFNAVFLIALCVSILLEALTRFIEPPEIDNPKMMLVVGCAGLFSNLLGFVVLGGHGHSHGHSHGDHDHDHDHDHEHAHDHVHDEEEGHVHSHSQSHVSEERHLRFEEHRHTREESSTGTSRYSAHSRGRDRDRRHSLKSGHSRLASFEDMSIHPASFRQDIIAATTQTASDVPSESDTDVEASLLADEEEANEESPLLKGVKKGGSSLSTHKQPMHSHGRPRRDSSIHHGHNHTLPKKPKASGHGHSHDDMGMNAMVLHVIGDALGNVGVIVTGLIIWLTNWPGKLYADPIVSVFITIIILQTSIPLTRATARVLLQATPEHINIQEIREDIETLPCVVTCHHIHVWQLSDTKLVASMHIQVSFPIDSEGGEKYMELARRARKCLHAYGIHSATIQPEFSTGQKLVQGGGATLLALDGGVDGSKGELCLLECIEDCRGKSCCSNLEASSRGSSTRRASESSHSASSTPRNNHNHDH